MKSLANFDNIEIGDNDIIIVDYPVAEEATKLYLDDKTKKEIKKKHPISRPVVIAAVGSAVTAGVDLKVKGLKRGDFVFLNHTRMVDFANLLLFDNDRQWVNPVILPAWLVEGKVKYAEEYENEYEAIANKIDSVLEEIKAEKERLEVLKEANKILRDGGGETATAEGE